MDGKRLRRGRRGAAVGAGVGLAPEERKSQALLLDEAVYRNITLSPGRASRGRLPRRAAPRSGGPRAGRVAGRPPADVTRAARTLSGGNQQKVVLARWLLRDCRVLLLDEPTRGVDVGARSEIYALIRDLADRGVAVVVVSSEIEEVLGLADRVLVIGEGGVVAEAPPPSSTSTRSSTWSWKARRMGADQRGPNGPWHERGPWPRRRVADAARGRSAAANGRGGLAVRLVGRNLGLVVALAILCIVGVDHRR